MAVASALTVVLRAAAVTLLPACSGCSGGGAEPAAAEAAGRRRALRPRFRGAVGALVEDKSNAWVTPAAGHGRCSPSRCFSLRLGSSDQGWDRRATTTRHAYYLLAEGFGPGFNGPRPLVAQTHSAADLAAFRTLEAACPRWPT